MANRKLVFAMCVGQLGSLLPHVVVPAVMTTHLIPLWGLSNSMAGLLAAVYAAGYMLAVPILTSLTDRIDARRLLIGGSLFTAGATAAFGLFAQGLYSAMVLWALAGIGFAGAYMPGLRALTDRLDPGDTSRSVTFYTSSYSVGISLSFLASQLTADSLGWRWAFLLTSLGPLLMAAVAASMKPKPPPPRQGAVLQIRPVLGNREAMGYILGYGAHCFELNGMRTWIVAFWTYAIARGGGQDLLNPIAVSVMVTVLAMPSSILGNEASLRFGRRRTIAIVQIASAVIALTLGCLAGAPSGVILVLLLLYGISVPAESGSLTSGMSAAADPRYKGATMAMHSTVGFAMSAIAGWSVGVALDAFGGAHSENGWSAAFVVMAAGIALGPLALMWSRLGRSADEKGRTKIRNA